MSKLITFANAKTIKGEPLGYKTGILYLSPANSSGLGNVCASASAGCIFGCLNEAGRGGMSFVDKNTGVRRNTVLEGRLRKTKMLFQDKARFYAELEKDINAAKRAAKREGLKLAIRLNGTSDLPSLARHFAKMFPEVQFYDYTKLARPETRILPNYSLTFSRSETNEKEAIAALKNGVNVAVVFDTPTKQVLTALETKMQKAELACDFELLKKLTVRRDVQKQKTALPETWQGFEVIDGDLHDLRFLDKTGKTGYVVGLRAKGKAKNDSFGFVVKTRDLIYAEKYAAAQNALAAAGL